MSVALHSSFTLAASILVIGTLSAGFVYEAVTRRRDARRFPPLGRLIDVGGRRLHLLAKGTGGPTIVIEQGAGSPSLAWLSVLDQVAQFACVCLYDRAGYQWSDAVSRPRTIEDRVRDLHALLKGAALPEPYILVAHSYGGFLVRLFARQYPDKVAGMVLVDTPHERTYFRREVLSLYSKFAWVLRLMKTLSWFGIPRLVVRLTAKADPSIPSDVTARINAGMVRRESFAAAMDDLRSCQKALPWILEPDALGNLGDIPLSVITHGQPFPGPFAVLEHGWREGQQHLAALSTNGKLIVADHSNHMIHTDQPEVIVEAIRTVIESSRSALV